MFDDIYYPAHADDKECWFRLKIPGFKKEELSINVVGDFMLISGKSDKEGSFQRRVLIANEYDIAKTSAEYKDGILIVVVPKKQEIPITIN